MKAKILEGETLSERILDDLKEKISKLEKKPNLVVFVGWRQ